MIYKRARKIIIDERGEVEKILASPPEKYVSFEVMKLIAKYYYDKGYTYKETKKKLIQYCKQSGFNLVLREQTIDNALKKAKFLSLKSNDYKIPITNREVEKLRVLSHKDYRLALYMLFIAKLEKYQNISKKKNKSKSFSIYFNYDIRTAYYNMINEDSNNTKTISEREERETLRRLVLAGILVPTLNATHELLCADTENNKNIAFIIDASKPFLGQVVYYCAKCGKRIEAKSTQHDLCKVCYKEKRDARKR